jgi:hypothetical protein
MYLSDLIGLPRVVEDALSGRCLPSVNVCHDPNIAVFGQGHSASFPDLSDVIDVSAGFIDRIGDVL